jgi:hypothetical protein
MQMNNPDLFTAIKNGTLNQSLLEQLIGKERAAKWHQGTCVVCKKEAMVGECDWCYACEVDPSKTLFDPLAETKAKLLGSLSGDDKNKGKDLFAKFSKLVLRKTVSFEQLLFNDFINPLATENEELEPYLHRLLFAQNGLEELEKIVSELSINNHEKEHKNTDGGFAMPNPSKTPQQAVAA